MTQNEINRLHDDVEAFFAYIEDPECEVDVVFVVEEWLEVTHP